MADCQHSHVRWADEAYPRLWRCVQCHVAISPSCCTLHASGYTGCRSCKRLPDEQMIQLLQARVAARRACGRGERV